MGGGSVAHGEHGTRLTDILHSYGTLPHPSARSDAYVRFIKRFTYPRLINTLDKRDTQLSIPRRRTLLAKIATAPVTGRGCGGQPFQTVRGCFPEGGALFEGSKILRESRIQVAVRDRTCIAKVTVVD